MRFRLGLLVLALALPSLGGAAIASPPLPRQVPTPILSYDGQGFGAYWRGQIISVARQGSRHWDDPTGRISLYTFSDGYMDWPPTTLVDTDLDDRNAAGGVTRSGALIFFYGRLQGREGGWVDLYASRIGADGARSTVRIPTDPDGSFSAYGPLVVLPSGRLMQTVYGWSKHGYRVRALFSNDDGRTWTQQSMIEHTRVAMPNETAAVWVDGATDATSRLMAFSRSARWIDGQWTAFLNQSISSDGGRTWKQVGWVGTNQTRGVVPWVANIGGGRLALVTVIRSPDNMTVNVAIGKASEVFANPKKWPAPTPIYRSTLQNSERIHYNGHGQAKNYGDFGYPSIVQTGPRNQDKYVIFYDSHTGDSGLEPYDMPTDTDLILMPLFSPRIR